MGTNDLSLGPAACPFLIPGRRSKHFDMDGKLSVSLNTITLAASETRESVGAEIILTTNSSYLTGSNLTYSGGRGSSALKIGVTYSGLGGAQGIYIKLDTSGVQVTDGHGVMGIKCIVVNTAALSDGEVYGAQFIAKHNHATNVMTAQASLIGLEAWAYISDAGPARTVIGANFAIHNECTGTPGAGSVHRVVQLVCDNASGAVAAEEATGLCIWEMAGTWDNAIKIVASVTPFVKGINFGSNMVLTAINVDACSVFFDADVTLAVLDNAAEINVTDTAVLTAGISRGLYVNYTNTGAKTVAGEVDALAVDVAATTSNLANVYAIGIYMTQTGNKFTGQVFALGIYMEDVGTAAGNVCAVDIGRVITNKGSSRDCFIRCKGHGGIGTHVVLVEGTSNQIAGALFGFLGCGGSSFLKSGTCSGAIAYSIKVLVHSIAGDAGTAYYIPMYPTKD